MSIEKIDYIPSYLIINVPSFLYTFKRRYIPSKVCLNYYEGTKVRTKVRLKNFRDFVSICLFRSKAEKPGIRTDRLRSLEGLQEGTFYGAHSGRRPPEKTSSRPARISTAHSNAKIPRLLASRLNNLLGVTSSALA